MFLTKLWRQERVDKGNIVMNAANLKDFLPAQAKLPVPFTTFVEVIAFIVFLAKLSRVPPVLDIPEKLDTQLVWVNASALSSHRSRMVIGIIDQLRGGQALFGHDGGVPIRCPAFVHDLRLALR